MVVGLIFKVYQPLFCFSVDLYRNYDAAGIDLIRLFLIFQFAFAAQLFHCHKSQIHKAYIFILAVLIDHCTVSQIFFISIFNGLSVFALCESHIFKLCREGGMTAVVRPVSIQHADLCYSWISVFFSCIILLYI